MYEELIKFLRSVDENDTGYAKLIYDAADAIEELQTAGKKLLYNISALESENQHLKRERAWIPVTERLPKEENSSYWICTDTGYQCECRWTNNIFGIGESGEWGWCIVDVPQYHKVVAWMDLPELYKPPKEES